MGAVSVALIGLAFASGGFTALAAGVLAIAVWLPLLALALAGRLEPPPAALVAGSLALAGLAGLTALSLEWSRADGAGFADLILVLAYLGAFLLAGFLAPRSRGGWWLSAIALGGTAIALAALAARLLGVGEGDAELAGLLPSAAGRLSYPIGYWNALGALMAATLPAVAWLAADARTRRVRGLAAAAVVPIALVIWLTASRGAILAAGAGLAVALLFATDRRRGIASIALALLAALPAAALIASRSELVDRPASELEAAGAIASALVLLGALAVYLAAPRLAALGGPRLSRRGSALLVALAAVALLLVVGRDLGGPAIGTGRAPGGSELGVSSGRFDFWGVAVEAFADEPIRGVGAGGYGAYWNANGELDLAVQNAHSAPLEMLAELGLGGLLLLLAFLATIAAAGRRAVLLRGEGSGAAGAAGGVVTAAVIGLSVDWIWEVPAALLPAVLCGGLLCGGAFGLPGAGAPVRAAGWLPSPPRRLLAPAVVAGAVVAIWLAAISAIGGAQLEASEEAQRRGDLEAAAEAARAAAAVQPWAAEPLLRLVEIEQGAGNLEAARRAGERAAELAPGDFRPWLALGFVEAALGNRKAAGGYLQRAQRLAPRLVGGLRIPALGAGFARPEQDRCGRAPSCRAMALSRVRHYALPASVDGGAGA